MNQVMERTSFKSASPTLLLNLGCPDIPPHVIMLWNASEAKQSTSQLKRIPGDPLNSPQFSVKDIECFWQSIQKLITHLSEELFQLWELHKYNIILQIKPSVPLDWHDAEVFWSRSTHQHKTELSPVSSCKYCILTSTPIIYIEA